MQGEEFAIHDGAFAYTSAVSKTVVYNKLNLAWDGKRPVLLRGRNGAGKTTLLRLIAHLEEWDDGKMTLPQKARPEGVFLVPQDLELPPKRLLAKLLGESANTAVKEFSEFANLQKLVAKESLSGGERAKVALLWALASPSKILLLDEPLAGIALADRMPILEKFMEACNRMDKWFLISSHDALPADVEGRFLLVDLDHENPV
jgi:ABC-type Mn2+/Zn2+ transport system ATPase subunit